MLTLALIALRNLAQHRRRTLLLGAAIAGVTAILILLVGLSSGVRETMLRSGTTLSTGHVNVGGFFKVTSGQAAPVVTEYPKIFQLVRDNIPELDYVVERGRGFAKVIGPSSSRYLVVGGIDIASEPTFPSAVTIVSGALSALDERDAILLFEEQAKDLGVEVGDMLTLSAPTVRGANNTLDVTVGAIARDAGLLSSFSSFISSKALRKLYQLNEGATGAVHVYLKDVESTKAVQAKLRELLTSAGYAVMREDPRPYWMKFETVNGEAWTGQKLDITTWNDELGFMNWTLRGIEALSGLLIAVLIVIIGVGIMNTLWISVRERTREIGTLRAIGMQRRRVLAMFVAEGFLLGLLGTVVGGVLGLSLCLGLNAASLSVPEAMRFILMSEKLHLLTSASAFFGSVLFITACTTVVSLFPSYLAARMKPISAMHHIG